MKKTRIWVAVLVAVVLTAVIGSTLALLIDKPPQAVNTLEVGRVTCQVNEQFNQNVKQNVSIKNTSNISAYIRVKLIPIWRNTDGTGTGIPVAAPTFSSGDASYSVTWASGYNSNWFYKNGYFYCKQPIAAGANTPNLVGSFAPAAGLGQPYAGKQLELQVICSAIQAGGTDAVNVWGVTRAADGSLVP